ncbi:terminase family protein, partial [Candidatus Dojkabacteria bacterium]|nr:terminase family protein [Candidatus Dojkabacteria bacterium]
HYCLFNNEKGVMIVANKGKTVIEIIRKIKDIYKLLPFYLKKGILNWNEKSIAFDNGCRIQSENRTKEPSIGFTIDFLYLDEFAKVPSNIIEPYYSAVVPTVSAINNSKIVITSTPDGFNMFHKLLIDAERDIEDPLKGMYEPMRVYWYQVKGRMDVKLLPLAYKLKEHNFTVEQIKEELEKIGYILYEKKENNKTYIYITWDVNDLKTDIAEVRRLRLSGMPLSELCLITNWKEDETKLIGGEHLFNQEYNLHFVTGDKLLFDTDQMNKFKTDSTEFEYVQFSKLDQKLHMPYNSLKWIKNRPDLFSPANMKKYHIVASIDLGEGLGQDYSVLNIFRLMPKNKEEIELTAERLGNVHEYFYLEQIGLFRVNNWSVAEFAELFYLVMFELFDVEKSKVVLEYNTYGATLISELPKIFEGNHNYSSGIFLRYKHRKDDDKVKIGIKVTGGENEASKKLLVKDLQGAVKKNLIKLHNDININEISLFTKKETASGNFTYKCQSGHDDCLLPDTWIKTDIGYKKIKDIKIDDLVLTHLGNYKKVTNICIKNFNGDMYKVKFKGQAELDITYNHPIYVNTFDKNKEHFDKMSWCLPGDLKHKVHKSINIIDKYGKNIKKTIKYQDLFEKHSLCAESNIKIKNIILDDDFAKFLGLFLADGNCYKPNKNAYRISIAFNKNQIDLINEMKSYFEKLGLKYQEIYQNGNAYSLRTSNKTLYELLIHCYDFETKEKVLPYYAKYLGEDLKYVLEYWLKGDGWTQKGRNNRKNSVIGCSTSLQLALSMRDIATSIGKNTLITKNKRKRYDVICKDQYWVTIYDERPKSSSLTKISDFEISSHLDYIKKYNYKGITYNLEVEDDNSYVANGIVVHNCIMSTVSLASAFSHVQYKNLIENMIENELSAEIRKYILDFSNKKTNDMKQDYEMTNKNFNKVYKNKSGFSKSGYNKNGFSPWKTSPWD